MREIKFRGQDFETGEWLYGSYNGVNAGAADVFIIYEKEIIDPVSFGFIDTDIVEKGVKEETVGQYTGLKDKNGVDIYEGDIVRVGDEWGELSDHEIKWGGDYPAFELYPGFDLESNNLMSALAGEGGMTVEVIGNIYENPELLK